MAQKKPTLEEFDNRIAVVVTDLNGFRSSIANDEITEADFGEALILLFTRLREVEQAVEQMGNEFWKR